MTMLERLVFAFYFDQIWRVQLMHRLRAVFFFSFICRENVSHDDDSITDTNSELDQSQFE